MKNKYTELGMPTSVFLLGVFLVNIIFIIMDNFSMYSSFSNGDMLGVVYHGLKQIAGMLFLILIFK